MMAIIKHIIVAVGAALWVLSLSNAEELSAEESAKSVSNQPASVEAAVSDDRATGPDKTASQSVSQGDKVKLHESVPVKSLTDAGSAGQSQQTSFAGKSKEQLLAELRDLYSPDAPGWWPLAPGWWVVASLLLCIVGFLAWWLPRRLKRQRENNWKKSALTELQRLCDLAQAQSATPVQIIAQASILMRRVSLTQMPRAQIAAVTDDRWLEALDNLANTNEYSRGPGQLLTRHPYMRSHDIDYASVDELLKVMRKTIQVSSSKLHKEDLMTESFHARGAANVV